MDLNCLQMGTNCDQVVSGETLNDLIVAIHGHMKLAHGYTDEQIAGQELDETIRGAIWSSSRPPEIRTPHPEM